jgi:site-specific recombinase XerD
LRVQNLDLTDQPRVQLHGKGNKWRTCPLWTETARQLRLLVDRQHSPHPDTPVFESRLGRALTRFGIYKLVRRHTDQLKRRGNKSPHISPHLFRHTAAVHLLEAGVEVNVIRGWLGHASLLTTNRYAEITTRTKEAALRLCEPLSDTTFKGSPAWQDDKSLLAWLNSL